jgi:hypothetical protein
MRLKGRSLIVAATTILLCCGSASARSGKSHGSTGNHATHWSHFHPDRHRGGRDHSSHGHANKRQDRHSHDHAAREHRHDLQNDGGDAGAGADHSAASWFPEGDRADRASPSRHSDPVLHFRETTTKSGTYRREWSTGSD